MRAWYYRAGPTGEVIPLVAILIAAGASAAIGAAIGAAAGAVGWAIPALLPMVFPAVANVGLWGTVGISAGAGAVSSGAAQVATNLYTGATWHEGLVESVAAGAFIGAVAGGAGYGISKWWAGRAAARAAGGAGAAQALDDAATGPLRPGEAGRFGDLDARAVPGDNLTPHHMPQKALGWTPPEEGGALVMSHPEHAQTRTYFGGGARTAVQDADKPFRDVLASDIRDVRSIVGNRYNKGLQNLIDYYRTNFPYLMRK